MRPSLAMTCNRSIVSVSRGGGYRRKGSIDGPAAPVRRVRKPGTGRGLVSTGVNAGVTKTVQAARSRGFGVQVAHAVAK